MSRLPTLLRGRQPARALWFDTARIPDVEARILHLWSPGAELRTCHDGLLLRLSALRHIHVATAPALVFVENDGLTCINVTTLPGTLTLLHAGVLHRYIYADLPAVEPATWLDISSFAVVTVEPLGPVPSPAPAPPGFDVRVALKRPPTSAEAEAARAAFAALSTRGSPSPLARWLAGVGAGLLGVLGAIGPSGSARSADATGIPAPPAPPPPPSWLAQLARRIAAPLWGPLLGGAHGRYLGKLFDLFDSGKLEDALRHAIPLGGTGGWDLGPNWSLPGPRANLSLGRYGASNSSSIGLETTIYQQLRQLYERALVRLLAEDRLDDAVFVLVELLREYGRAVELLEERGKFALAAELAEAGDLAPEIAVRLWMRAGESTRAILVARRKGAFAAAIEALRKDHGALAIQLRSAWAHHLADRGDFARACEVAWAEPTLRPAAVVWLDAALGMGGPAGARLIAYLLRDRPELFAAAKERIDALLLPEGWEAAAMRSAVATGLLAVDSHEARTLLRPVFRRIIADQAALPHAVERGLITQIRDKLDEPALAADVPPAVSPTGRLEDRAQPLVLSIPAGDAGSSRVTDIVFLGNGGVLVALGELGARLYGRDGRVRARFDEPVTTLVPFDAGGMAIGIHRRDWGLRLSRLDLVGGTVSRWHDAQYSTCAPTCDGNLWFVGEGESIIALDAVAPQASTLWRVNRVGGPVTQITVSETRMCAFVDAKVRERWAHVMPAIRLAERRTTVDRNADREFLGGDGDLHVLRAPHTTAETLFLPWMSFGPTEVNTASLMLPLPAGYENMHVLDAAVHPAVDPTGVRRIALLADGLGALVAIWRDARPILFLTLHGASASAPPRMRVTPTTLSASDAFGRAIVIELTTGQVLRNLRI